MPLCGGSKNVQRKLVLLYAPTPAGATDARISTETS